MKPDAETREAAAHWLQRLPDRNIPEAEMSAWLRWYGADENNRRAFDDAQAFQARLRGMDERQREILRAAVPLPRIVAPRRRGRIALAACVTAALLGGGVWWTTGGMTERGHQMTVYTAPADRHQTVRLPDGSIMALRAGAIAHVSYTPEARRLEIVEGAAYFEVARDAQRLFTVRAGEVSVTAVGTAFSVAREADQLSITVTQGSVDVARAAVPKQRMHAGERATVAVNPVSEAQGALADKPAYGWQGDSIQFHNAPLSEVVAAVNEYAHAPIAIEDPRLMDLNYSGTVFRQRVDEWIAALPQVYPVRNVALDDGTVAVVSAGPPGPD
jgi:transmembrane sensor